MLLAAARTRDTSITAMYETIRANDTEEKVEPAVRDLEYNLTRCGPDAAWRKAGRKPVVFIYGRALRQLALGDWSRVVRRVHEDLPGGAILIPDTVSKDIIAVFDGSCVYTLASHTNGQTADAIQVWARSFLRNIAALPGPEKISTVTVMPGFDDHVVRPPPRPITERWDGQTYRVLWREAIKVDPDYVLITSWNEWHEGTEIEPSVEFGSWFLRETATFSKEFRAQHHR